MGSLGSRAMDETRPVTRPKLGVRTAVGPSGCQVALDEFDEFEVVLSYFLILLIGILSWLHFNFRVYIY